jgi:multiple sugar transport system substrate-binding protein
MALWKSLRLHVSVVALSVLAAAPAHSQTVTIAFVATEAPATYAPAIAAFEKENPGIKVEYQQIPFGSFNAQIEARIGSKDPSIDVYSADTPRVPALAARGYLLKLDDYRKDIEAIATPNEVNAISHRDVPHAFPLWTGTQLLYYNKTLLAAAGVKPPSADPKNRVTWEQLLEHATAVQKAGAKYGFTYQQVDRYFQLQPLFESVGAGSGLTGPNLLTPSLTNDKWISVATWYQKLFDSGLSPRGVTPEQTPDLFINGQVGYFYGGLPMIQRFNRAESLQYGVAPVPYFAGSKPVTSTGSWAIGVSPYSTKRKEALQFARFLTLTTEGAWLAVANTSAVPVNKNAYEHYLKRLAPTSERIGAVGDILSYEIRYTAVPRPRSTGYVVFEDMMNKAFSDIRNGAEVRSTLTRTEAQLKSTLSRVQ